jgi:hypothetical protein
MRFTPEEIERMTPAIREEICDWLVKCHNARARARTPDRRRKLPVTSCQLPAPQPWPRCWYANDSERAYMRRVSREQMQAEQAIDG